MPSKRAMAVLPPSLMSRSASFAPADVEARMASEALDAVREQLEPQLALHPMGPGDRGQRHALPGRRSHVMDYSAFWPSVGVRSAFGRLLRAFAGHFAGFVAGVAVRGRLIGRRLLDSGFGGFLGGRLLRPEPLQPAGASSATASSAGSFLGGRSFFGGSFFGRRFGRRLPRRRPLRPALRRRLLGHFLDGRSFL